MHNIGVCLLFMFSVFVFSKTKKKCFLCLFSLLISIRECRSIFSPFFEKRSSIFRNLINIKTLFSLFLKMYLQTSFHLLQSASIDAHINFKNIKIKSTKKYIVLTLIFIHERKKDLKLEYSKSLPVEEKMMRATSASHKTESSSAFLINPLLLFEKVTCLAVAFSFQLSK